jgi:hypothetical protein
LGFKGQQVRAALEGLRFEAAPRTGAIAWAKGCVDVSEPSTREG